MPMTRTEIVDYLRFLADSMAELGMEMGYHSGFDEIVGHGQELIDAASIIAGWVDGIEQQERQRNDNTAD